MYKNIQMLYSIGSTGRIDFFQKDPIGDPTCFICGAKAILSFQKAATWKTPDCNPLYYTAMFLD